MSKVQILVVEDESIVAMDIKNRLQLLGYAVPAIAFSGEQAVSKAKDNLPDLILMDIKLKGDMDGIDAAEEIKALYNIPVVYLTAYADDNTVKRAKITEPFGYLLKPFEERELHTTIEMALYKADLERKLKESEEKHRNIVENSLDGIVKENLDSGEILSINPAFSKIFEYEPEDIQGKSTLELGLWVDQETRKKMIELLKSDGAVHDFEYQIRTRSGEIKTVSATCRAIHNDEGKMVEFEGIIRDISRRFKQEEQQRYLATILSDSADAIVSVDYDDKIKSWNKGAESIFGYTAEEILGKHVSLLIPKEMTGDLKQIRDGPLRTINTFRNYETVGITKSGKRILINATITSLKDKDGEMIGYSGILRDITEQKRMEEEVMEAKEEAELYLDLMSHDINNKNQVAIFASQMISKHKDLNDKQRLMVDKIYESVQDSSKIISRVKKLQQIKKEEFNIKVMDIDSIIRDAIDESSKSATKEVEINYESRSVKVYANEMLFDVFYALLDNSILYSEGRVTINILVKELGKEVEVSVVDDGLGISDELKEIIFKPLEREKMSVSGSGLGLYMVKALIDRYSGSIYFENSVYGDHTHGTRFCITLPSPA